MRGPAVPPETAMILAAGLGTRMRPLTNERPKPLITLAGRTLIDRALDLVLAAGVGRAVINLHYLGAMIRDHLAARAEPEVLFSEETPRLLDTGGGVARALPLLGGAPFFVVNPDTLWLGANPLDLLARHWREETMSALLLLVPRARARAHGGAGDFFLDSEGGPPRRRGATSTAPLVYSGAQIMAPGAFADAPAGAFSLNLIWDRLASQGRLAAITYPGTWVDVGTPAGLATAEHALAEGEA